MRLHAKDGVVRQVELGDHIIAVSLPASLKISHDKP